MITCSDVDAMTYFSVQGFDCMAAFDGHHTPPETYELDSKHVNHAVEDQQQQNNLPDHRFHKAIHRAFQCLCIPASKNSGHGIISMTAEG